MYFNYHAKVKRLIGSGQARAYEFCEEYHKISPCLLIYMKDGRMFPIRAPKFAEYIDILLEHEIPEKKER